MKNIFFDYNSTTPMAKGVMDLVCQTMSENYGNPSSLHLNGRQAREVIETAREKVASLIGSSPIEVHFTSGGSESNNWALLGLEKLYQSGKNHIITSKTEHSSVYETALHLCRKGIDVTFLPVDREGRISTELLNKSITAKTALISLMAANNETGTLLDLHKVSSIAQKNRILFHCDAVQAAGKIFIDVNKTPIDMLSLSAHKIYGPKGTGALYIRKGLSLSPLIRGGNQESGKRAGTENVAAIAGLGEACRLASKGIREKADRLFELKVLLYRTLQEKIKCTRLNGSLEQSLANTLNMSFPGCESDTLVLDLDQAGYSVSAGSACRSKGGNPSRVLKEMNLKPTELFSALRFSLGESTTKEDVLKLAGTLSEIVERHI